MKNGENIAGFCCLANTKIQSPRQENTVCSVMLVFIFCCSPCVRLAVKQIMNTCWMRWNLCISNVDPCSSAIYKQSILACTSQPTKPTTNHMIHKFHTFATQPMTIILIVLFENDKMNTFQLTRSVFFFLFFSSIVFFLLLSFVFLCVSVSRNLWIFIQMCPAGHKYYGVPYLKIGVQRKRCGDSQRFFYMEVGRHSAIGAGELYMETEDPLIAQNMHTTIIK